ncbi:hypothetical protein Ciccas_006596 [Cichlidogyrus casuarinus]|uniref:Saccharopine dehydrogenase (NAD(+), L-glutamate-forming) n=1 Tax=Cichlidogyrus casuarinus TaxID=1844966 RepID=A0ABD2Q5B4_9PLAT
MLTTRIQTSTFKSFSNSRQLCKRFASSNPPTLGIPRESINLWERRAALSPIQVSELVKNGVKVLVQPSNRRAYLAQEYEAVGAEMREDLSEASFIIGVKKPSGLSIEELIPNKTYAFFTHTIKAQPDNMDLLDTLLERNIRIIDYEKMLDQNGQRVVAFGNYAGIAGMINILHGMGVRLLALGHTNPFLHIGLAHNYRSVEQARQAVRDAGYEISLGKLPPNIGPLTFAFTGSGNVSIGAQYICKCLPIEYVKPSNLKQVAQSGDPRKVYAAVVSRADHYERRDGGGFDPDEFNAHPDRYISTFMPDAKLLLRPYTNNSVPGVPSLPHHLLACCDISADPGGSIEFMQTCTTIDKPFCLYDAEQNVSDERVDGPGLLVCSVDNMPAQIPREATNYFGSRVFPYLKQMLTSDASTPLSEFKADPIIKNAIITSNGQLTSNYEYIDELRKKNEIARKINMRSKAKKQVLVLGSGYVVPSLIEYLARDSEIAITVISNSKSELNSLSNSFKSIHTKAFDVLNDVAGLNEMAPSFDLVISMLPWKYHPVVADVCINNKVNMLTASYRTPQLREMASRFEEAGITAFMEIGLDPGIDHLLAMELFDEIKDRGGIIEAYHSYTGGIPAPENSDNALRYKFSWSPEAALSTVLNGAKYLKNGHIMEIPAGGALMKASKKMDVYPGFNLESYPNRDSMVYAKLYGLEECPTVVRGTLRYEGYCKMMQALIKFGLMDNNSHKLLQPQSPDLTWRELLCKLNNVSSSDLPSLKDALYEKIDGDSDLFKDIETLSIFSNEKVIKMGTPLATIANLLTKPLSYLPYERDMIIMSHLTDVMWPDHTKERKLVRMVAYGDPALGRAGFAMSRTVGIPAAIAAKMMLDGEVKQKGIVLPLSRDLYRPILKRLKAEGIYATESSKILSRN